MDTIIFAFSVLTLIFMWKVLWQPTLLDKTRDDLFYLRDDLRRFFIKEGYGLDHPMYHALRARINMFIRHAENISICNFAAFVLTSKKYSDLKNTIQATDDLHLETEDCKLKEISKSIRMHASVLLVLNMLYKNFFVCVATFVFFVFAVFIIGIKKIFIRFMEPDTSPWRRVAYASLLVSLALSSSIMRRASINVEKYVKAPTVVENCVQS